MAETDPFGREQGEDPLAEMGWKTPAAGERPAEVAAPEEPKRAGRRPTRTIRFQEMEAVEHGSARRRPASCGCALAVFVVLFIASIAAFVIPAAIETADDVRDAIPTIPAPEPPRGGGGGGAGADQPPRGLERRSLLRRENLAPLLRRLRGMTEAAPIRLVRLDAESLLVLSQSGGRARFARATWSGGVDLYPAGAAAPGPTFAWSRLDAAAPERIVRAATRGRRAAAFDYLVLRQVTRPEWSAFLRAGGGTFNASLDGRRVERVG